MMKKTFFLSLLALTAFFLFAESPQAEARGHHRSHTSFNVKAGTACNDTYIVRRYAQPVVVAAPAPVYITPAQVYAPVTYYRPCITPTYVYQVPTVVEEVRVAPAPRPVFGLGGLSFSWNFFR